MSAEVSGRMMNSSADHWADVVREETDAFSMLINSLWKDGLRRRWESVVGQLLAESERLKK
jgi:hypothetical protein